MNERMNENLSCLFKSNQINPLYYIHIYIYISFTFWNFYFESTFSSAFVRRSLKYMLYVCSTYKSEVKNHNID
jgi:hypothetical protein